MRHLDSVGLVAMVGTLVLAPGQGDAAPLDFIFGGPPLAQRQAYRLRRRPAPPPTREIPLPVPRPHLPGDPPPNPEVPAAKPSTRPAEPASPSPAGAEPASSPKTAEPVAKPTNKSASPRLDTPVPSSETSLVKPGPDAPALRRGPESPATTPVEAAPNSAPSRTTAASVPTGSPAGPPTPPPRPADLAMPPTAKTSEPPKPEPLKSQPLKPEAPKPTVAPSGATLAFTPRAPEDDPQCPTRLLSQKVGVEPIILGPQPDARCSVVEPVHLADLTMPDGSKVAFPEHPTIACVTADSFSSYVRDMLSPLAKGTFGAPVAAVWTGPGLECRSRDHVFGAKLSAHGQGLAIDIARLKLADGRIIEVGTPSTPAEAAFETAARAGACGYFHTVLGPGSDSYHRTHWHFDLEVRGAHGDSKYCK